MKKLIITILFTSLSLFAFEKLSDENFESKIKDKNVIIDFYADWCFPCKVQDKRLEEFELIKSDKIEIYKVDIMKETALKAAYEVERLPTLFFFKNGKKVKSVIGIHYPHELEKISKKVFKLKEEN